MSADEIKKTPDAEAAAEPEKTEAAAARVEKIAKKGGLNAETVDEIRREILGMAS